MHQAQATWQRDNAELQAIIARKDKDIAFLQDKVHSQQVQPVAIGSARGAAPSKKVSHPASSPLPAAFCSASRVALEPMSDGCASRHSYHRVRSKLRMQSRMSPLLDIEQRLKGLWKVIDLIQGCFGTLRQCHAVMSMRRMQMRRPGVGDPVVI